MLQLNLYQTVGAVYKAVLKLISRAAPASYSNSLYKLFCTRCDKSRKYFSIACILVTSCFKLFNCMYFAKRRSCKQKLVQLTKGVANLLQTVAIDERCRKLVANLLQTCCKLVANFGN
jgi:hypothetical protein